MSALTSQKKRIYLSINIAAFTVGVILILFQAKFFISPGKLSYFHSTLEEDCAKCHSVHKEFTDKTRIKESKLCLKCHEIKNSFVAHNYKNIATETEKIAKLSSNVPFTLHFAVKKTGDLSCTACHREHQGRKHHLIQVNALQCQICHVNKFASFANGHSEISSYAYKRKRTHDHSSQTSCLGGCHKPSGKYITIESIKIKPMSNKPRFTKFNHKPHLILFQKEGCQGCHVLKEKLDPDKLVSNFKPFEKKQCSQCHNPQKNARGCLTCHNYHNIGTFILPKISNSIVPQKPK